MNASEIIEKIEAQSVEHTTETRVVLWHVNGSVERQGDVYVEHVADDAPRGKPTLNRQLAPGNSKGSRHVVEGEGVEIYESRGKSILEGPLFYAPNGCTVTHPEHADVDLPDGTYRAAYQLDPRTRARVAD